MPKLHAANRRSGRSGNRGIGEPGNRRARDGAPSLRRPVSPVLRRGSEDPRALALDVLQRVEATDAYANLLLDARLQKSRLTGPDRALVTELVYGVLRWRGRVDWILAQVLDRPIETLDRPVRQVLRLGVYQLCLLTRVPEFAAVDEAVSLIRGTGAGRSAGYVNAVLRSVARRRAELGGEVEPHPSGDPVGYWTTVGSHPRWLVERWIGRLGSEEAGQLMAANNRVPPVTLVVIPSKARAEDLRRALIEVSPAVEPGRWFPEVLALRGAGGVSHLPGFAQGWFIPMDEAGIFPVLALEPEPGQVVLDACAGGGGKCALIAARVGVGGQVLALDRSPRALQRLQAAIQRLGLGNVQPHLADARSAGTRWPGRFPRVLVDAPCTGLGTIRRRPEIKWRRRPEDLTRSAILQRELLHGVAGAVAPDGVLVYSTCSLEQEETDAVSAAFLDAHPDFRLDGQWPALPPAAHLTDERGCLRAWPHRHGTDGFFVVRLRRSR